MEKGRGTYDKKLSQYIVGGAKRLGLRDKGGIG